MFNTSKDQYEFINFWNEKESELEVLDATRLQVLEITGENDKRGGRLFQNLEN